MSVYEKKKGDGDSKSYCCSTKYADGIGRNFKIHAWKDSLAKRRKERRKK